MDNAAKALLIAGGVLIAVLVASIGIYLMKNMGEDTARFYQMMEQSEISEFNEQFMKYDGREDLTMQEVVSIMNLARDNNKKNGDLVESDDNYISVKGEAGKDLIKYIDNYIKLSNDNQYETKTKDMIKKYIEIGGADYKYDINGQPTTRTITFSCEITKNTKNGLVKTIQIKQINH